MNLEKKEGGKAWRADWRTGVGGKNNQEDIKGGKTLCGVRVVRSQRGAASQLIFSRNLKVYASRSFRARQLARRKASACWVNEPRIRGFSQLGSLSHSTSGKVQQTVTSSFSVLRVEYNNVFRRVGLELKKSNNNIRPCISALLTYAFSPWFLLVHPPRDISCCAGEFYVL